MDIEKVIAQIAVNCINTAISHTAWRDIGFARRPIVGSWFQRFRKPWKVALEKRAFREMLSLYSAAHVQAWDIPDSSIHQIAGIYNGSSDASQSMGFSSQQEGVVALSDRIAAYSKSAPGDWDKLLFEALKTMEVPDHKLRAKIMIGIVQFCTNIRHSKVYLMEHKPEE